MTTAIIIAISVLVGAAIGLVATALCVAASRGDDLP